MTEVVEYSVKKRASQHWEAFANGEKMVEDMPFFKTKKEAVSFLQKNYSKKLLVQCKSLYSYFLNFKITT